MNQRGALFFPTLFLLTKVFVTISIAQITETKLIASDGGVKDVFGFSVSLSGDYALVGASGYLDNGEAGSAYIFYYDGLNWIEQTKLRASDGDPGDSFGYSVSLSGDYALVGASEDGDDVGSAYIFHYNGLNWIEQAKLIASDGAADDRFGASVSLSGDYAIVGAWGDDDNGDAAGSAYVFHYDGSTWVEQTKLLGSDAASHSGFGLALSLSDDYALVGAFGGDGTITGSAYIYQNDGSNWVEQTKLEASDGVVNNGFGNSVSLSGNYALVGAVGGDEAAYVFHYNGSNWIEQAKLLASDGVANDDFGISVSLSGDYALVGAFADDDNGAGSGSAYIFHFNGSDWIEQTKLLASDGVANDGFGISVSLSSDHAFVGAYADDDNGDLSGSAYVYADFGTPGADPLAQYGIHYGSTGSAEPTNPGALITIDPLTGDGTLIGATGIVDDNGASVPAIAIRSTGEVYAVSSSNSVGLYTVNASTGVGAFVASTGLSTPNAMAFDGYDQLYIADGSGTLYTLDETTGAATIIGPLGFNVRGIAFDPTDGTMYGSSGTDGIYTINPTTAVATFIGNTGLGGSTPDIHFDLEGNLFGTKIGGGTIYNYVSINKQTGVGTLIGSTGFTAVIGLSARQVRSDVVPVTIEIEIDPDDQTVPPGGATFPYAMTFTNNTPRTQTTSYWTKLVRPTGNPFDPFDGPTSIMLDPFETLLLDTNEVSVPPNAVPGDYSLIGYVGTRQVDTVDIDTTGFTKLDDSIPCEDIAQFKARCRLGGLVQAKAILTDFTHVGETVEISVDQFPYEVTVGINGQATFSQAGFNPGVHTVELTDPQGCFPATMVTCGAGLAKEGDDEWNETWEIPTETALLGNYPNPFNPSTTFRYGLAEPGHVSLKIYNMLGQLVRTIVDEQQAEGYHEALWDGRNDFASMVSSGMYIYRMTAGSFVETRGMMLVK